METVIKVKNIWKDFKIYYDKGSTLKEKILFKIYLDFVDL